MRVMLSALLWRRAVFFVRAQTRFEICCSSLRAVPIFNFFVPRQKAPLTCVLAKGNRPRPRPHYCLAGE